MASRTPIAPVLAKVIGPGKPIAFEAFDGSTAGPAAGQRSLVHCGLDGPPAMTTAAGGRPGRGIQSD